MRKTLSLILIALVSLGLLVSPSLADNHKNDDKKVTICHAAGRAGTTKYVTLTISRNAVYKDPGGHFYENGTPQAGHEQDYLGPCKVDETTTTTVIDPEPPKVKPPVKPEEPESLLVPRSKPAQPVDTPPAFTG